MNYFKENIKFLRKQKSITQGSIALQVDKGQTTIGNWENGISEPNINELILLSNFFGISLTDLVCTDLGNGNLFSEPHVPYLKAIGKVKSNVIGNPKVEFNPVLVTEIERLEGQSGKNKAGDEVMLALLQHVKALTEDVHQLNVLK